MPDESSSAQTMALPLSGAFPTATQRSYQQARIAHSWGLLNLHAYMGHQRDQRHGMRLIRTSRQLALLSLHLECAATILIMLAEFDKSAERTARDPFYGIPRILLRPITETGAAM